jgi:hypothetical protein
VTLFTEWQFSPEQLEFFRRTYEDPAGVFGSTEGEHGYQSARVLFSYLPEFLTEDPYLRDLIWAMAVEIDAVRAALDDIARGWFVRHAPASWALALWEDFVGRLPAQGGLTTAQRRAAVLAAVTLGARTLRDFRALVAEFAQVDENVVIIQEDFANYQVSVTVQAGLTDAQKTELEFQFRRFLPAHLEVTSFSYGGFIAGVALAGDTL